jgi:hypothetical protein
VKNEVKEGNQDGGASLRSSMFWGKSDQHRNIETSTRRSQQTTVHFRERNGTSNQAITDRNISKYLFFFEVYLHRGPIRLALGMKAVLHYFAALFVTPTLVIENV